MHEVVLPQPLVRIAIRVTHFPLILKTVSTTNAHRLKANASHLAVALIHFKLPDVNVPVAVPARNKINCFSVTIIKRVPFSSGGIDILVDPRAITLRIHKLSDVAAAIVIGVEPLALSFAFDERRPKFAATGPA